MAREGEKGKRDRFYNIGVHVRITASLRENGQMHRRTIIRSAQLVLDRNQSGSRSSNVNVSRLSRLTLPFLLLASPLSPPLCLYSFLALFCCLSSFRFRNILSPTGPATLQSGPPRSNRAAFTFHRGNRASISYRSEKKKPSIR